MTRADTQPVLDSATRIAAFGLAADRMLLEVDEREWPRLAAKLTSHRLTGLAVAAFEAEELLLTDEQRADLLERHKGVMFAALSIERKMLRVTRRLEEAGIRPVILKGPALAHTIYPDPSLRSFGDLDLLVRTEDWRSTCDVLAADGYRRGLPEPHAGFDERFGKAAVHRNGDGIELDLHRTLVLGPFGLWLHPDELFDHAVPFQLGGRQLLRLDDVDRLIHACLHASLGFRWEQLWTVRDVAQCALAPGLDWEELEERAGRWRVRAVVAHALRTASDLIKVRLPDGASEILEYRAPRTERRALETFLTERRDRGGTAISTLRAIPGVRGKAAYIRALAFPDREFLQARSPEGSYIRRWRRPLQWLTRRGKQLP
jgi:Uncharacterised nucleotidyltransferase